MTLPSGQKAIAAIEQTPPLDAVDRDVDAVGEGELLVVVGRLAEELDINRV